MVARLRIDALRELTSFIESATMGATGLMADANALMTGSCASEAVELRSTSPATSSTQWRR